MTAESLSARRAWIEIIPEQGEEWNEKVALRKESVDRNECPVVAHRKRLESLSARRAWIEITALHPQIQVIVSRSPQGERG